MVNCRLSRKNCDQILIFENGDVKETGNLVYRPNLGKWNFDFFGISELTFSRSSFINHLKAMLS